MGGIHGVYTGRELFVDLGTGEIRRGDIDIAEEGRFLGGMGIQLKRLYGLLEPGIDPFSPENPIIIGAGPLVGTNAPGSVRVLATLKYPETGAVGSGAGSMRFGVMLKLAGYDYVVITGRAASPVYLRIVDDDVRLCDATDLWGRDTVEATNELWGIHGDCGVVAIGQAGEQRGRIAQAAVDGASSLGRGGFGGVMGSKNLKALVAKGTGSVRIADAQRFSRSVETIYERARRYPHHATIVKYGIMPNWPNYGVQFGSTRMRSVTTDFEKVDKAVGFDAYTKLKKKAIGCPSCIMVDKEIIEVAEGRFKGVQWSTPSYLNAAGLGGVLGLKDSGEAVKVGEMTDRYGLDQISLMGVMDCLITLYEDGSISLEDVGGLPLTRDVDTALTWCDRIALREGFGDVAADGWHGLRRHFGDDLVERMDLIKGRQGVWDPRLSGLGTNEFAQLVYPRGPNAESGGTGLYTLNQPVDQVRRHAERMGSSREQIDRAFDSPLQINIGRLTVSSEHWLSLFNSLGICNRHVNNRFYHIDTIAELYSAATGTEVTPGDLMEGAERVWNLFKMINLREGFTRKDDEPPRKWFEPMRTFDGKELVMMDYFRNKVLSPADVDTWLDDYYDERGWNAREGAPTREKLTALGLEGCIPDLPDKA